MIRPVSVSVEVPYSRKDVYDFLDVMANHELFTDHVMKDWEYSGPPSGVGSKARVHVAAGGKVDTIDIVVVSGTEPSSIVEENTGAKGKRIANGTYRLDELPGGKTRITFEYAWRQAPFSERLAAPVIRRMMRQWNEKAMQRLSALLDERLPEKNQ
ncbi:MAG TPA: SRPBCC family protein [Mycobacteriales bacterium]|nr:SRPBCC family protein [Mycobacteriales bacterium]